MTKTTLDATIQLGNLLQRIPDIVSQLSRGGKEAEEVYVQWLIECENTLHDCNFPESGQVAAIRAQVVAKRIMPTFGTANRRERTAYILQTVQPAQEIIYGLYAANNEKVSKVRTFIQQYVSQYSEVLLAKYSGQDFSEYVRGIYSYIKSDANVSSSFGIAVGTIGQLDVMRLLAEALNKLLSK